MVMTYPLIDSLLLSNLRLVHGGFNFSIWLLFLYQGWLGLTIRRARLSGAPLPLPRIRRHRQFGPLLALLGGGGFLVGLTLAFIETGNLLKYPPHLFAGVLIVTLLWGTYLVSRKIQGRDPAWRTMHYRLGIAILCLYVVGIFLGIGILL